jgi:hypothetical protein
LAARVAAAVWLVANAAAAQGGGEGNAAASRPGAPRELGRIKWSRDFETTRRSSIKPILLLFQEVPG